MKKEELEKLKNLKKVFEKQEPFPFPLRNGKTAERPINKMSVDLFNAENFLPIFKEANLQLVMNFKQKEGAIPKCNLTNKIATFNGVEIKNVKNALDGVKAMTEFTQMILKKQNDDLDDYVIPALYAHKFYFKNLDDLGGASSFWYYYDLLNEAINLSKYNLENNVLSTEEGKIKEKESLKNLYASLIILQAKQDETDLTKNLTVRQSGFEYLQENNYGLNENTILKYFKRR